MTERPPECDSADGQAGAEIEVTPAMIQAGVTELREHASWLLSGDHGRIVEAVFLGMCLERRQCF